MIHSQVGAVLYGYEDVIIMELLLRRYKGLV